MHELWDVYNESGEKIKGRTVTRGRHDMNDSEYHLVVYIWIIGSDNSFVISKRQTGKSFGGSWECTGGCAQKGDSSISAAIREVKEELGISLDKSKGELFKRYKRNYPTGAKAICDVWVFKQDVVPNDFVLQKSEVSEARIVSLDALMKMFDDGVFGKRYRYINELIQKYCTKPVPTAAT